jgi:hypothetical protein
MHAGFRNQVFAKGLENLVSPADCQSDGIAYEKRMKNVQQTGAAHVILCIIFSSFCQGPELGQLWLLVI